MKHLHALLRWLEAVEEEWLGWSLPPTRRELADARWDADSPSRYCPRCGGSVGAGEVTVRGCGLCRGVTVSTDGVVRLGAYEGRLRDWIRAIKYRGWAEMADALGRTLGESVRERLGGGVDARDIVVVPMPMPWQRRIYRGIDHARLIAMGVAARLGAVELPLLSQTNGAPQVALSAARRPRRGARLALRKRARRLSLGGIEVVLVDDVRTTGSSLRSATRLLRGLGAGQVTAAVLAVTDDPSRRSRIGPGSQTAEIHGRPKLTGP